MNYLVIDIEGTYCDNPYPWVEGSYLSLIGIRHQGVYKHWVFAHKENIANNQRKHIEEIQALIDSVDLVVAHNLKFDLNWLRSIGIKIPNDKLFCTLVAEYLIRGQRKNISYSLDECCKRYDLPKKTDKVSELWEAGIQTDSIPLHILVEYCGHDCAITDALFTEQQWLLKKHDLVALSKLSFEVLGILSQTELNGFTLDVEKSNEIVAEYRDKLSAQDHELNEQAGYAFNPGSWQQLSVVLYGGELKMRKRVPVERTLKSGRVVVRERWENVTEYQPGLGIKPPAGAESATPGYYATDKNTLQIIKPANKRQAEFINLLLDRSNTKKVLSTFQSDKKGGAGLLDVIGKDGRVHPQFNQAVTATGRLSSSRPNGQNLPRKSTSPIKKVIKSRNGRIVNVDLAQIEWRMAGALSLDPVIVKEVCEKIDAHGDNAIRFFKADRFPRDSKEFSKIRTDAKIFTFGMIYGRTAQGFFNDKKMPDYSIAEWQQIVKDFYTKYAGLGEWQQRNVEAVLKSGRLRTPSGRILVFPKIQKYDGSMGPKEQAIFNYPVQSISADVMNVAMVEIMREVARVGLKSELILQVHDSLVFDAFENEVDTLAKIAMGVFENLPTLCKKYWGWEIPVPTSGDVEVGLTYGDIVSYNIFTTPGKKYLYSYAYLDKEGKEKKDLMWCVSKESVLAKHPDAFNLQIVDEIHPD